MCQITVKYTNVNIKNSEDPLSTHFFKIRLKAQPGFTRVNPMGKPGGDGHFEPSCKIGQGHPRPRVMIYTNL